MPADFPERSPKIDATALVNRWVHSHEEDSGKWTVYRSADFAFPPARGRAAFELKADHTCVDAPIAPQDGNRHEPGHWELRGDELHLHIGAGKMPPHVFRVISVAPGRLVVTEGG